MKNENNINTPVEEKSMSAASLILGIVSIIDFYFAIFYATLAIIFGILGKKKGGARMAIAGIILGIAGLLFGTLWLFDLPPFTPHNIF